MQKITIIGNVGQDPVVKVAQTGTQYFEFSVGVYANQNETQWYNVRCFTENQIDYVNKNIIKGTKVYVEGRPNYYISNAGKENQSVGVSLMSSNIEALSGQKQQVNQQFSQQPNQQFAQVNTQPYKTTYLGQNIQGLYNVQPQQQLQQQPLQQPLQQFSQQPNQAVFNQQGALIQQQPNQQFAQPQTQVVQNQQPILPNNQVRF